MLPIDKYNLRIVEVYRHRMPQTWSKHVARKPPKHITNTPVKRRAPMDPGVKDPHIADIHGEKFAQLFAPEHKRTVIAGYPEMVAFSVWLEGRTPLICHAWSEKARIAMYLEQTKKLKAKGKEPLNPDENFLASLYDMGTENGVPVFGFPMTGLKACIASAGHRDKGIPIAAIRRGLWLNAEMVRVRPAHAGAICDMPLIRIYGSKPEMREDMVRVGSGIKKTAAFAYRAQFTTWAARLTGEFSTEVLDEEKLVFLIQRSGIETGIGDWRMDKSGMFGSFSVANAQQAAAWDAYAAGKGPLPKTASSPRLIVPAAMKQAAE